MESEVLFLDKLKNLWTVTELRKKLFVTLAVLLLFRVGCAIPVPFIDNGVISGIFEGGNLFAYMNMLSGGALSQCAVFALGVSPYINSSIVVQLLTVVFPQLDRMRKEETDKYRKIMQYVAAGFALIMAIGYYAMLRSYQALAFMTGISGVFVAVVIVAAFVAGSQMVVWLGWQIDDYGIGNGVSLMIFAGIISRWADVVYLFEAFILYIQEHEILHAIMLGVLPIFAVLAIYFVVKSTDAEKRVPIQYSRSVNGKSSIDAGHSYIPIKVVMSGVMPIIFASTIMSLPATIGSFIGANWNEGLRNALLGFNTYNWVYDIIYIALIFAFNYFYIDIQFDAVQIANSLRKNGGTIPGIRPGIPTTEYLERAAKSVAFLGALILAIIAALPIMLGNLMGLQIQLGGTTLLIVCGVALEAVTAVDSYMVVRQHKGFLD